MTGVLDVLKGWFPLPSGEGFPGVPFPDGWTRLSTVWLDVVSRAWHAGAMPTRAFFWIGFRIPSALNVGGSPEIGFLRTASKSRKGQAFLMRDLDGWLRFYVDRGPMYPWVEELVHWIAEMDGWDAIPDGVKVAFAEGVIEA